MRKIDKTIILATEYKNWQENILDDHPKYNSSSGKYYFDIIANLLWVQKGLCAYTEVFMMNCENCCPDKWTNGSFKKFQFAGELDHYNPNLKVNQGWLWDNLFLIDADVNSKKVKGIKVPFGLLKPDKVDFSPINYLEYDAFNHIFIPTRLRSIEEQESILHDINTLGLNWEPIVHKRVKYLNEKINDVKYGFKSYEDSHNDLYQFFTAFEMSVSNLP